MMLHWMMLHWMMLHRMTLNEGMTSETGHTPLTHFDGKHLFNRIKDSYTKFTSNFGGVNNERAGEKPSCPLQFN